MNDQAIEQEIQAKGLTAARVKPTDIEANIKQEFYFRAGAALDALDAAPHDPALDVLTFCVLVLQNGFTVTGESACASPENFDAEIGRSIARQNAVQKIWPLMGYALKDRLANIEVVAHDIETITFDQFVQYGRDNGGNIVGGMPWSFNFRGHPVTHETNQCYLIMGKAGKDLRFTSDDVLVVNQDGSLATIRAEPVVI